MCSTVRAVSWRHQQRWLTRLFIFCFLVSKAVQQYYLLTPFINFFLFYGNCDRSQLCTVRVINVLGVGKNYMPYGVCYDLLVHVITACWKQPKESKREEKIVDFLLQLLSSLIWYDGNRKTTAISQRENPRTNDSAQLDTALHPHPQPTLHVLYCSGCREGELIQTLRNDRTWHDMTWIKMNEWMHHTAMASRRR